MSFHFNMFKSDDIIILKINRDKLLFNLQDFLSVENIALELSTITDIEYFEDRFHWLKVKVLNFDSGTLRCKILEYNPYNKHNFNNQTFDISIIENLLLSSGDTWKILNLAKRKIQKPEVTIESGIEYSFVKQEYRKPALKNINIEKHIIFEFPFRKLQLIDGYAIIKKRFFIDELHRTIDLEIKIENGFIKNEFDSIKNYFINFLKIKNIKVKTRIQIQNEDILVKESKSSAIHKIAPGLIDEVKYRYIKKELLQTNGNDGIHTVDELFGKIKEKGINPDTFNINDTNFIKDVIKIKSPKHFRHIDYLSALHKHNIVKLRIIKKPFSFLFFLESEKTQFFIWETLFGTDGTYIWLFKKSLGEVSEYKKILKNNLEIIKEEISKIKTIGRIEYLKSKPENFIRIFHKYSEKDGFGAWEKAINELTIKGHTIGGL